MYEDGIKAVICGREFNFVFTLAALLQIKKKFGGLEDMIEVFSGPTIQEWDDAETVAEKQAARGRAQMDSLDHLPWLIATLANQGEWLKDTQAEAISPDWIAMRLLPKDVAPIMQAVNEAIAIGMGTEAPTNDAPHDPVLEELDRKNAEGAAE